MPTINILNMNNENNQIEIQDNVDDNSNSGGISGSEENYSPGKQFDTDRGIGRVFKVKTIEMPTQRGNYLDQSFSSSFFNKS